MKKIIILFMFLVSIISFSIVNDGMYYVEKKYDNNWVSFVKLTVKSNKIIGVQYDKKNNEKELMSIMQAENEKYAKNYGETFRETSFKMGRSLITTQNIDTVNNIKDNKSLNEFKEMVKFLIEKAKIGQTGEFKI